VRIEGAVDRPASHGAAELRARAPVTQTVGFDSSHGAQAHTFTGTSLWSLLNEAGIQAGGDGKQILDRCVMAVGADGYRVVFSMGELHPDFGARQSLVAYAETNPGATQPLPASSGPLRVTAPGDIKGGRYVSNLTRIEVLVPPASPAGRGGGVSPGFTVSGQVKSPKTFDLASLQALPASSVTAGSNTYQGVKLWTLLDSLGLRAAEGARNPSLPLYAVVTGSDGYQVVLSLGEIDPSFGNKAALIAYDRNGEALGRNGMARLVVPGEIKQGRSVSNLVGIEVLAAPTP
jgi:DMSO/TMAO reductase YedYZ molybdopterin-dependent catalytic subunit